MKNTIAYLLVALLIAATQYFLSSNTLNLIIWVLLGVLLSLLNIRKRIFLVGMIIGLLIGFILFFKLSHNDASYIVVTVQQLGYSATTLKTIIVLFNALTVGFSLLLGSSLVQLITLIRERK